MNTVFFLGETINGENPATSSEIESTPKWNPKTVRWSPNSSNLFLPCPMIEYIMKLQLHQHSLLTRKVFSRHKLLAQVFFSVSSGSSLSSHHLHLQVIFIWIWIITWSGSSSLDLDHHYWIWIITRSGSTLVLSHDSSRHRNFYKASPFHAGCRPTLV